MENQNSGLLIAALVAIVAVVGLVILFSNAQSDASAQGALMYKHAQKPSTGLCSCPPGTENTFMSGGQYNVQCYCRPKSA